MQVLTRYISIFLLFLIGCQTKTLDTVFLAGEWAFQIDVEDVGEGQEWFSRALEDKVTLPGSMKENSKGFAPTLETEWTASIYDSSWYFDPRLEQYRSGERPKFPFMLTPVKEYVGAAWYQRQIEIPADWSEKRMMLFLERAHWETTIWVDDQKVGVQNSLVVPHEFELTDYLSPGSHLLTIRVDNRVKDIDVGKDSHSISDHTQGNWNGVIGRMELIATDKVWIENVQAYPDLKNKLVKVQLQIGNDLEEKIKSELTISATSFNTSKTHSPDSQTKNIELKPGDNLIDVVFQMGDGFLTWDEFEPALYKLTADLELENEMSSVFTTTFGMREFVTEGTRFYVNGRPTFLRGNCDCAIFPLTGYPPTDLASWMKIFGKQKAYGINHVRFHSWNPPAAAFEAADRLGLYMQTEGPSWANHGSSIGDGLPIDQYIYDETNRINQYFGNHPSFCMMAYGNEPYGSHQAEWLNEFVTYWKEKDERHLYTGASVGKSWPYVDRAEFIVKSYPRGVPVDSLPHSQFDHRKYIEEQDVPYVSHEIGQYCVYPNFKEIRKYTGVYEARNFELFQEDLKNHGMMDQADDFLMASGKLQALFYKAEIEAALRTPGFGGFQMLQLNDFPGQGTALVGILDAFYDEKGYIDSTEFTRFCDETVLLARLPKFIYQNNETFTTEIEASHFGSASLLDQNIRWEITTEGNLLKSGEFEKVNFPITNAIPVGEVNLDLSSIESARKLVLSTKIVGSDIENSWEFWVYPADLEMPDASNVIITGELTEEVKNKLIGGANVLLLPSGKVERGKEVEMHFKPVFWNTSWFKMRPPHTLGHLTQSKHPAFADFPTEYHSNYQWWELTHMQQVMILDDFPEGFKPLVQPIDTWFLNRKLGLIFEVNVGKGKVLVCSADIISDWDERPVAKQMYYSLLRYMNSDQFDPDFAVDYPVLSDLFEKKDRAQFSTFSNESPDELQPKKHVN